VKQADSWAVCEREPLGPSREEAAILRSDEEIRERLILYDVLWEYGSDGKVAAAPREVHHGDVRFRACVFREREKKKTRRIFVVPGPKS